jgi:hypothetical protein
MFTCKRCGHNATTKGNLLTHLKRKRTCQPLVSDISVHELISEFNSRSNSSPNSTSISNSSATPTQRSKREKTHACLTCNKMFTSVSGLSHHKHICKGKIQDEIVSTIIETITTDKHVTVNVNFNDNSNQSNTQNNTLQMNRFLEEDISHITNNKRVMLNHLQNKSNGVAKFIKDVHFDMNYPENQTIRLRNVKRPFLQVWNNDEWEVCPCDEVVTDLINNAKNYFDEFINDNATFITQKLGAEPLEGMECYIRALKDLVSGEVDARDVKILWKQLFSKIMASIINFKDQLEIRQRQAQLNAQVNAQVNAEVPQLL